MALMDETILTLGQACRLLPANDGKRVHLSTLWRWCRIGVNGVRLEYLRVGRRIVTSKQALERFMTRLAALDEPPATRVTAHRQHSLPCTRTGQSKRIEHAESRLRSLGL